MIKITHGNMVDDLDPWKPNRNSFKACENVATMGVLLTMISSLKEGDYIIIQKKDENNM